MNLDLGLILSMLAGLFLIIGIGFVACKARIVSPSATPMLSSILMRISLPCTFFGAMMRPYDPQFLSDGLTLMLLSALFTLSYALFSMVQIRLFRIEKADAGAWFYSVVFCNAGFIGYPIALALYGTEGLSLAVILNVPLMLLAFSVGIYYIQVTANPDHIQMQKPWKVLISECNISLVLGLVFYLNQWTLPDSLLAPINYLGAMTTPLSLLIVGISLAGAETSNLIRDKRIWLATLSRLIVYPAITYGVLLLLNLENPLLPSIVMVLLATPSPATSAALTATYGGNETLAAKITFLTSLLCMLTLPMWAMLF